MSCLNSDLDFGNKPIKDFRDPKYLESYRIVNINCDQIINMGGEEIEIIKEEEEEQEEDELKKLKKLLEEISERLHKLEEVITNK